MENYVHRVLEQTVEEARILLMFKLYYRNYERMYLRDSNGYIKRNAKM